MKEVSKEVFDTFYEDNLGVLNRTPKYNSKENSVSWFFESGKKVACKFSEYSYNKCRFFINETG